MTRNNLIDARRRGSALLIVLGFLAFMIVSAVTYSIYMRAERLPSSALRRTVATRHLVHAALARAISQVDDAVRDDPYPGLTGNNKYQVNGGEMDHWVGRIFLPPSASASGDQLHVAPISKTVSTLTLEGLGYIPPPLVNDARFLSRSSWAGQWNTLPFDSGRSAYCAINVTDMLDVTRLYADKPRSSTEGSRISLAYLFDSNFDPSTESGSVDGFGSEPAEFDKLVHDQREGGNGNNTIGKEAPFVSMLDYSLGIQKGIAGVMESLFYKWINGNGGKDYQPFYEEEGDRAKWARRQPFVTESCATNQTYQVDIATVNGQPFNDSLMKGEPSSVMQVASASTDFFRQLKTSPTQLKFTNGSEAGILFATMLYDYLDHDSMPISLAMPCVERAPMLAGLAPEDFKVRPMKAEAGPAEKSGQTTTTRWKLNLQNWIGGSRFRVIVAFPYKHNLSDRNTGKYTVQMLARLAVVPSSCTSLRSADLHEALRPKDKADWEADEAAGTLKGTKGVFCVSFKSKQDVTEPSSIVDDDQAGKSVELRFNLPSGLTSSMDFLDRKQTEGKDGQPSTTTYTAHLVPLGTDGKPAVTPETEISSEDYAKLAGESYTPMLFVWMRIVDSNSDTVDLVPAVLEDDQDLNGVNSQITQLAAHCGNRKKGPLLRFVPENSSFNWQNLTEGGGNVTGEEKTWSPQAFATVDPRFNWAPEDWYGCAQNIVTDFTTWLDSVNDYLKKYANSEQDLDSDIFTFTSDQGFLQSLGEFAFLPRVTNESGTLALASDGADGYDGELRTTQEKIASKNCVWRSYRVDREFYEAMEARGIGRTTMNECLVNPYSSDLSVLLAAFANSPSDYWSAGLCAPSEDEKKGRELKSKYGMTEGPKVDDAKTALKYAFCSKNDDAKLTYSELIKLANAFKDKMRGNVANASGDKGFDENLNACGKPDAWKAIFDDYGHGDSSTENYQLQWWARASDASSFDRLFGVQLSQALYGVDRKFLYSYWRDCFANQQQLFLIFVRAESNALGGSGEGTPGQKGGRAVAMVWRNPSATDSEGASHDQNAGYQENRKPHQTRILFYHQFE